MTRTYKKETVQTKDREEAVEFVRTALKERFTNIEIRANHRDSMVIEISIFKNCNEGVTPPK